ncbi:hypothetical protein ACFWMQ_26000 [Streptomyces sp. NPDC058372]|uniref:hypothetical protein n=1 Tax=Streptomyces sp. NPDC058372 TaxID=3346464 RepID=UPI00366A39A7
MSGTTGARPRVLAVLRERLAAAGDEARGALWRLAEDGRELDANLVRLAPGAAVGEHRESVLDVLLVGVAGNGRVEPDGLELAESAVLWLPRGARRAFTAGPRGLAYLTVHRRRPGLAIGSAPPGAVRPEPEGGEAPCFLDRVCPGCGRVSDDPAPVYCSRCGEAFG